MADRRNVAPKPDPNKSLLPSLGDRGSAGGDPPRDGNPRDKRPAGHYTEGTSQRERTNSPRPPPRKSTSSESIEPASSSSSESTQLVEQQADQLNGREPSSQYAGVSEPTRQTPTGPDWPLPAPETRRMTRQMPTVPDWPIAPPETRQPTGLPSSTPAERTRSATPAGGPRPGTPQVRPGTPQVRPPTPPGPSQSSSPSELDGEEFRETYPPVGRHANPNPSTSTLEPPPSHRPRTPPPARTYRGPHIPEATGPYGSRYWPTVPTFPVDPLPGLAESPDIPAPTYPMFVLPGLDRPGFEDWDGQDPDAPLAQGLGLSSPHWNTPPQIAYRPEPEEEEEEDVQAPRSEDARSRTPAGAASSEGVSSRTQAVPLRLAVEPSSTAARPSRTATIAPATVTVTHRPPPTSGAAKGMHSARGARK
ncbi:hypothetical protein LTR09_005952 [Extremus antarcticus]|uniref:Uncharacterized protein n=1 Tax=Extremus antarcticus TaxID=702011 RepID=A0AAJ0DLW9_9PEZI|nr:hypothetical protein LTR09_005952 [Extremus antarcticus]